MLMVMNLPASSGDPRDMSLTPGSERSLGVGNSNPLQYSFLENSMDRGAWWATVLGLQRARYDRECTHSCIKPEREKDSNPGQSYEWVTFRDIIDLFLIGKESSSSTSIRMYKSPSQLYTRNLIQNNGGHGWGSTIANLLINSVKPR